MTSSYYAQHVGHPSPHRRIITGKRDCFTGIFPSSKPAMGYRMVAYEGLLARHFMAICDADPDVVSYQEEPPPFEWTDGWRSRRYFPDVAVTLADGRVICVEVKPSVIIEKAEPRERYLHIAAAAEANGYSQFEVWTEEDIYAGVDLHNALLLASEITFVADEAALHQVKSAIDALGGSATIRALRQAANLGSQAFRTIVRLIAQGVLAAADPTQLIDDRMIVQIPQGAM